VEDGRLTREELVKLGLALPLAVAVAGTETTLAATPSCADDDEPTVEQTEGPYFTPRSPRRRVLRTRGMKGTPFLLTGRVLTTRCRPIPNALLDFWQADANGVYDNRGYRLRGHQRTDSKGRYRLETVVPGLYPGRTRHIHVKAQAPRRPVLTTQLYFRGERANAGDGIFLPELLVRGLRKANGRWSASFDFVLEV
jgi:protocatechuate 3,4-dioxygenase beta subunit